MYNFKIQKQIKFLKKIVIHFVNVEMTLNYNTP
jgi:hypothetical protein